MRMKRKKRVQKDSGPCSIDSRVSESQQEDCCDWCSGAADTENGEREAEKSEKRRENAHATPLSSCQAKSWMCRLRNGWKSSSLEKLYTHILRSSKTR